MIVLLRQGRRIMNGFLKYYSQHQSWNWCVISRENGNYSSARGTGFEPTHWMPLPAAPKEGEGSSRNGVETSAATLHGALTNEGGE
jgi:hypothetical protein